MAMVGRQEVAAVARAMVVEEEATWEATKVVVAPTGVVTAEVGRGADLVADWAAAVMAAVLAEEAKVVAVRGWAAKVVAARGWAAKAVAARAQGVVVAAEPVVVVKAEAAMVGAAMVAEEGGEVAMEAASLGSNPRSHGCLGDRPCTMKPLRRT